MVFSSNVFLFLFLPLFLSVYYLARPAWRSLVILAGSYLFYAWWRPDFLLLFVAVTYWNYLFGSLVYRYRDHQPKRAFYLLTIGVLGNLAALGYFKYANFGVDVIAAALQPLGINTFTLEYIILPLGISFYIFQAITYVVDIYRKDAEPARNFVDFAAYIALFPQLIAGPILHYRYIDQQFKHREHSWDLFSLGAARFMLGFIKKVLIADSLAPISANFLANPDPQMIDAWAGSAIALVQLYFDFSGYSNMAIGLGMMMGFRFVENFNQPFLAKSMTEFWRRWHLTLADFLKNYIYVPLMKAGLMRPAAALFATMLISGIWHGASFAFIAFGLYFAITMVLERKYNLVTGPSDPYRFLPNLISLILLAMVMPFFTTGSFQHSLTIYAGMFGFYGLGSMDTYLLSASRLALAFVGVAVVWLVVAGVINTRFYAHPDRVYFMADVSGWPSVLLWGGFLLAISKLVASSFSPFLYFQF